MSRINTLLGATFTIIQINLEINHVMTVFDWRCLCVWHQKALLFR